MSIRHSLGHGPAHSSEKKSGNQSAKRAWFSPRRVVVVVIEKAKQLKKRVRFRLRQTLR